MKNYNEWRKYDSFFIAKLHTTYMIGEQSISNESYINSDHNELFRVGLLAVYYMYVDQNLFQHSSMYELFHEFQLSVALVDCFSKVFEKP